MFKSIFFRIILIAFAIRITLYYNSIFPNYVYFLIIPIYFGIYYYLKTKEKSIIRLIWDFTFINALVYGKDIHDPLLFFFILLPMINAVNFTGKNSSNFLLLLLTAVTFVFHIRPFETWLILPMISLSLLCFVSIVRYRDWTLERSITSKVDGYFLSPIKMKSHEIYSSIISDLNDFFRFKNFNGIRKIMVYTLKGDTLWLVNASCFLWTRSLKLSESDLNKLRVKGSIKSADENFATIYYYVKKDEIEYVFACELHKGNDNIISYFRLNPIMRMTFHKLSMLLNTEYRISQRREEKFNEIKDSILFVNQSLRVMHFIRNKMTPVSNLLAYLKMEDKLTPEKRSLMKDKLGKVVTQADKDFKDMLKYADYLLEKSNNPFGEMELREVHISKVFILLSEIAQNQLNITVEANDNIQIQNPDDERVIHFNTMNCKIILTDWIANMRKYGGDYNKIYMGLDDDKLIVHFENSYIASEEEINCLVKDMNNNEKDAVLEGKNYGHGIYIIKSLSHDYGIKIYANNKKDKTYGNLLTLDYIFTTYERKKKDTGI